MDYLQRLYQAIVTSDVSSFFAILIAGLFGLAVLARIPVFVRRPALARILGGLDRPGPAILTTLGVLGTFFGIFFGLLDFNVQRIDESVPQLLVGMKIAFATSILGMGTAVVLKLFQVITPQRGTAETEVTPEIIHGALTSIDESVNRAAAAHHAALEGVRTAISADSDSSLLTQVQKLRTTVQDGQKELIGEFRAFALTMAETNSKALIEALEAVIRDFNTQLNEQFGENFKQLNAAVGALLTWQENYRDHVEKLEGRIDMAVLGIEASEIALRAIVEHTEKIPEALASMEKLLTGMMDATEDLEGHLEAVSALKAQALDAFPVIDANLKRLTDEFGEAVRHAVEQSMAVLESQKDAFNRLQGGFTQLLDSSNEAQGKFAQALEESMEKMHDALTKAMETHTQTIEATASEMQRQIADAWTKTQDTIEKQFGTFDDQLQQELRRVLEAMGQDLAALSEKFVSDYGPLTEKLREVVQIAGRAS